MEAWWFDPRTGIRKPAGRYEKLSEREFTTPPGGDWLLELLPFQK